jgi:signal transduction histidine kinase
MRWGLRYQLLVPPVLLLVAVVGITTWTAVAAAKRARQQLEMRILHVVQSVREPLQFDLSPQVLRIMRLLSGAELLQISEDGKFVGTLTNIPDNLPPPGDDPENLRLDARVRVDGQSYLCSGVRLRPPREDRSLYVLYPESLWRDALWEAIRPSLLIGGGLGLAAVILAGAVAQSLTRRIQELERRTRQIASGDFSPMPLPPRYDEIRDLAASVNDMAQRLASLQEAMQRSERLRLLGQVSGGLAHQLRNGVQGARLAVQLHQRELAQGTADPATLDVALRQLTLVETNLKRFLDLGSRKPGAVQACSLTALVAEAVALVQPKCRHAGIALRWHPPQRDRIIQGDSGQLQELFLNILSNAVEAAGPGGTVEVLLKEERGKAVVEVKDSGAGPPAEIAARLFEPFVTGKSEGIGLGLAVSRQVAEGHDGRITWTRYDGWTCFRIELGDVPGAAPDVVG